MCPLYTFSVEVYCKYDEILFRKVSHDLLKSLNGNQLGLNNDLRIPSKLSAYGVKRAGIKRMSVAAMTSGNVTVNPRKTEQTDIEAIFSEAI